MSEFEYNFGDTVRDVTGFTGVVTARSEFMNGCRRYCVETTGKADDTKEYWFDEGRLTLVDSGTVPPIPFAGG